MTQAGGPRGRQAIAKASEEAIIALVQIAFVAFALRASDGCISTIAADVFRDPDAGVKTPNTAETADQREARRSRIVAALASAKCHLGKMANRPDLFDPRHLGGVANKMLITHAVAVLEAFLDNAAEPFKERYKSCMSWPLPRSFGGKCAKLKCAADLSRECGHAEADLLANVRHVIVHRNGAVDPKFLAAATGSKSPLARDLASQPRGDQVRIPIDDFILPAMQGAVRFVDAAAQALQGKVCP